MTLFLFSHFIQAWLLPPGLNLLLVFLGVILKKYYKKIGKSLIAISLFSLWILSTPLVAQEIIDSLQAQYPILALDNIESSHTAIVILGGGATIAPEYQKDRTISYDSLSRLAYAAYLYNKTHFPIIVSGGSLEGSSDSEANLMLDSLHENFKVPAELQENKSINTADESTLILPILAENKIKSIYLITNAWHMPRSMYIFNRSFKEKNILVIPAPMGFIKVKNTNNLLNYLPSLDGLNTSTIAMHEYIGLLWYRLYYR